MMYIHFNKLALFQTLIRPNCPGYRSEDIIEAAGLEVNASDAHFVETVLRDTDNN